MKRKPKGCKDAYIPWVCGPCRRKGECKPRQIARYERSRA